MARNENVIVELEGVLDFNYAGAVAAQRNYSIGVGVVHENGEPVANIPLLEAKVADVPSLAHAIQLISQHARVKSVLEQQHQMEVPRDAISIEVMAFTGAEWAMTQYKWNNDQKHRDNFDIWADKRTILIPDEERERLGRPMPLVAVVVSKSPSAAQRATSTDSQRTLKP